MKRPISSNGSNVTTPHVAGMMQLLGFGPSAGSVVLSTDEFDAIKKLYGYTPEGNNENPPPPKEPDPKDFNNGWEHEVARRKYQLDLAAHARWTDPKPFMQAGADRNALRHAEADGMRLIAWLAKYVEHGADPLKTLVNMAIDSGYDVDPDDVEWAADD